jgi:hypothetical protein
MIAEKKGFSVRAGESVILPLPAGTTGQFDRVWVMEDLSAGQKVGTFTLEIQAADGGRGGAQKCKYTRTAIVACLLAMFWSICFERLLVITGLFPCSSVGVCGAGGGGPQGGGDSPWCGLTH